MPRSSDQDPTRPTSKAEEICKEVQENVLTFSRIGNHGINALGEAQRLKDLYEANECAKLGFPKFEDLTGR